MSKDMRDWSMGKHRVGSEVPLNGGIKKQESHILMLKVYFYLYFIHILPSGKLT
jgi:hypothetical protein